MYIFTPNLNSFQILFHQTCPPANRRAAEQEASSPTENQKHTRVLISSRLGKYLYRHNPKQGDGAVPLFCSLWKSLLLALNKDC